jgi:plastocyanin
MFVVRHDVWVARAICAAAGLGLIVGTALAAESIVVQKGIAFDPPQVAIKPGDAVVFVNEDGFGHNVYSESSGGQFDIGLQQPGQRTAVPFRRDGSFDVLCRIHPKMKLKVVVQP